MNREIFPANTQLSSGFLSTFHSDEAKPHKFYLYIWMKCSELQNFNFLSLNFCHHHGMLCKCSCGPYLNPCTACTYDSICSYIHDAIASTLVMIS